MYRGLLFFRFSSKLVASNREGAKDWPKEETSQVSSVFTLSIGVEDHTATGHGSGGGGCAELCARDDNRLASARHGRYIAIHAIRQHGRRRHVNDMRLAAILVLRVLHNNLARAAARKWKAISWASILDHHRASATIKEDCTALNGRGRGRWGWGREATATAAIIENIGCVDDGDATKAAATPGRVDLGSLSMNHHRPRRTTVGVAPIAVLLRRGVIGGGHFDLLRVQKWTGTSAGCSAAAGCTANSTRTSTTTSILLLFHSSNCIGEKTHYVNYFGKDKKTWRGKQT